MEERLESLAPGYKRNCSEGSGRNGSGRTETELQVAQLFVLCGDPP